MAGIASVSGSAFRLPCSRLAGIYGPGRNAFCNLEKGTARRLIKPNQVFNRIRVEDIGACGKFLSDRKLGGMYNVTDNEPGPPQDVIVEAARPMGIEPPPEQPFETAELTPMARSFYGENKRVPNAKLRALGFPFRYPDYCMLSRRALVLRALARLSGSRGQPTESHENSY